MAKILILDIETAPITAFVWGLYDQNIGLNQIKTDWSILAWSAKWYGDPVSKVMYMDNSQSKDIQNDRRLVEQLAALLNQADGIITQNGEAFDIKKLNARAVINGLPPINPCKGTDILKEGRKVFKFTSHKLAYISDVLNTKYKKLEHKEYPGFELWSAILKGDKQAWSVMKKYCIHDVLATEEAYTRIQGWIKTQNLAVFEEDARLNCLCGNRSLKKRGYTYTTVGKYQRYQCLNCGKWLKGGTNLFTLEQKRNITRKV